MNVISGCATMATTTNATPSEPISEQSEKIFHAFLARTISLPEAPSSFTTVPRYDGDSRCHSDSKTHPYSQAAPANYLREKPKRKSRSVVLPTNKNAINRSLLRSSALIEEETSGDGLNHVGEESDAPATTSNGHGSATRNGSMDDASVMKVGPRKHDSGKSEISVISDENNLRSGSYSSDGGPSSSVSGGEGENDSTTKHRIKKTMFKRAKERLRESLKRIPRKVARSSSNATQMTSKRSSWPRPPTTSVTDPVKRRASDSSSKRLGVNIAASPDRNSRVRQPPVVRKRTKSEKKKLLDRMLLSAAKEERQVQPTSKKSSTSRPFLTRWLSFFGIHSSTTGSHQPMSDQTMAMTETELMDGLQLADRIDVPPAAQLGKADTTAFIAGRLMEMGDQFMESQYEAMRLQAHEYELCRAERGAVPSSLLDCQTAAAAIEHRPLTPLELELIDWARSKGDHITDTYHRDGSRKNLTESCAASSVPQSCPLSTVGSADQFGRTIEASQQHMPAGRQMQIAFIFYWTARAIRRVGAGSDQGRLLGRYCMRYVDSHYSKWIADQGGWLSAVESRPHQSASSDDIDD